MNLSPLDISQFIGLVIFNDQGEVIIIS